MTWDHFSYAFQISAPSARTFPLRALPPSDSPPGNFPSPASTLLLFHLGFSHKPDSVRSVIFRNGAIVGRSFAVPPLKHDPTSVGTRFPLGGHSRTSLPLREPPPARCATSPLTTAAFCSPVQEGMNRAATSSGISSRWLISSVSEWSRFRVQVALANDRHGSGCVLCSLCRP